MRNAILVHGWVSRAEFYDVSYPTASNSHWFPWLTKQLMMRDIHTVAPEMPNGYYPEYNVWKREFERFDIESETVLVGYSCGGGFLVRWLSEHDVKVGKVVLVAPWLGINTRGRPFDETFFDFSIDPEIAIKTDGITVFASTDDHDGVQKSVAKLRVDMPNAKYVTFENKGHFTMGGLGGEAFDYTRDIYRVSALMVMNGRGQVLLAQRSLKKPNAPGVWGPSVAGTVAMGESYIDTMVREAEEEIGLSGVEFEILHKSLIRSKRSFFCQFFRAIVDRPEGEFIIQTDEVEQIRWVDIDEVIADATAHPEKYTSQFAAELRNITPQGVN